MLNRQYIEKWIDREIKSIIKQVDLYFVCNNYKCYPRSGRNYLIEPISDLIVKKILNYNEKLYFLNFKYVFYYSNSQLSQWIINYSRFKLLYRLLF